MRKRLFSLVLCILICFALPMQAEDFQRSLQYGMLLPFENRVFGYSIDVYGKFIMIPEEWMGDLLDEIYADEEEPVYDYRLWVSPDDRYNFEIQVKQPTHASFEEEVASAPDYLTLIADSFTPEQQPRLVHEGILRETPVGTMLETAISYRLPEAEEDSPRMVFLYYDCYWGDLEYIFGLRDFQGDYETAQSMLDAMVQTLWIAPAEISL